MPRSCIRASFIITLLIVVISTAVSQESRFTITPEANYCLPIGPNASAFDFGVSATISGLFGGSSNPQISYGGALDFTYTRQQSGYPLFDTGLLAMVQASIPLGDVFSLFGKIGAGAVYSLVEWGGEWLSLINPAGEARAGIGISFTPSFGIEIFGGYDYHHLYNGASFGIGTKVATGLSKRSPVETQPTVQTEREYLKISSVELSEVFPVFYKYYDDHSVGAVTLMNTSDTAITNILVAFYINKYMDLPKTTTVSDRIESGEQKSVNLYALLNEAVLEVQEPTKVSAQIEVEYDVDNVKKTISHTSTLRMLDRNALTWDDDRKAAAFISAKDASVMAIAKNVAGIARQQAAGGVYTNLACGMGIHAALPHLGLQYVPDPRTPYEVLSQSSDVIDYVQYPRQTLYYRSGDCDDLSILYCSFLESIAIDSAFITVPGHIFIAFSLGVSRRDLARSFIRADDLIIREDESIWIPVEVTMIDSGFAEAWREGAKQWREQSSRGQAAFYPIHQAWELYEPVGISGGIEGVQLPDIDAIREDFLKEYNRYVSECIYDRVEQIKTAMTQQGETPKLLNRLGVIYASYGVYDQAKSYFEKAIESESYIPSLKNLGNLAYLDSDYETALDYFEQANEAAPDDSRVLLSLARTNHELENYGTARKQYAKLTEIDSQLADRFSYLDYRGSDPGRASATETLKREMTWAEE